MAATAHPATCREYRHLSLQALGILGTVPLLAGMVGDLVGGTLSDLLLRRTGNARLARRAVAVSRCRGIGKRDMVHNDALPRIEVDTETYEVRADGELLTCEAVRVLPMAQRYFLF